MKPVHVCLILTCLANSVFASQRPNQKGTPPPVRSAPSPEIKTDPAPPPKDTEPRGRVVRYGEEDVVPIKAKLRYTTLIVLPKNERILDFTCGDKEYWIVQGTQNLAYIKPAKAGSQSN